MQIILLSGGSGTRLWPLSNDARSKQFLRLLDVDDSGERESMVQRVHRQLRESGIDADITVATSASQQDSVISQLGGSVEIVTEPSRRDTFPAIALACEYLLRHKKCTADEVVVVMPCDPYTGAGYFECIARMADAIACNKADMMVMGIRPTYPSAKYGYIVPEGDTDVDGIFKVEKFTEKPSVAVAEKLIERCAMWNGGVFSFRLGYIVPLAARYNNGNSFTEIRDNYDRYPKISFDYEVAEKASNVGMVKYDGEWKDLGTWNTLTDELSHPTYGNVITDGTSQNTHIINELQVPLLCMGTKDLVIAASPDGIIVTEKKKSENVKHYASELKHRPMFEERRWGIYQVIDSIEYPDGYCALTKRLTLNPGCSISYQRHSYRDEVWTFIDGNGTVVLDGVETPVKRGDIVTIPKGQLHSLKADTMLSFIEVQSGSNLVEDDIERFPYEWKV